jgi:Arc/MetJ family transcription regulator
LRKGLTTRTLVDIDDDALATAAAELGTSTKVETINRALAEIAARLRRLSALERLRTDEDDLGEADTMRGAWR